ncbi:hypothetical protein F0562_001521 [Nyssa sinensis]|uniref:Uncharacterized protein n=1 Tax=Nyssa sinensis TaxID=561372 RepID=A0A5J5C7F3_9ASTE|nr:hypothetical protein F0562_001521 [Nyssa sinensis]
MFLFTITSAIQGLTWVLKISSLANSIRVLANMDEPIGHVLKRIEVADGLHLREDIIPLRCSPGYFIVST